MNYILSILFIVVIFMYYRLLGTCVLTISGYSKITPVKGVIAGFFATFLIGFVVGFPTQVLHANWLIFKYITLVLLILAGVLSYRILGIDAKEKLTYFKKNYKEVVWTHLKNYYLLYILTAVFAAFSMGNALPYYEMNYDDFYYIGKVVNQVGADALSTENYYNGAFQSGFDLIRSVNTFEVMYGFLGDLFHIDLPFFCRGAMVVHNYLLVFFIYREIASLIIKNKYAQYALVPFFILLIPGGYMIKHMEVAMFDGWQFQTAMFYGGSVVRVMAIPTIILFGKDLIEKFDWKKFIFMGGLFVSLMSFSSIFLIYAVMLSLGFAFVKSLYCYLTYREVDKRLALFSLAGMLGVIALLIASKKLDSIFYIDEEAVGNYVGFFGYHFGRDKFMQEARVILIIAFFLSKERLYRMVVVLIAFIYGVLYLQTFTDLLLFSAQNYFFVAVRFITSVEFMIIMLVGIILTKAVLYVTERSFVLMALAAAAGIGVISFTYINRDAILAENFVGSGTSSDGYSIEQLLVNDQMMPNVMVEVGDYFDSLEYGRYRLYTKPQVIDNGKLVNGTGFVFTSNRIETCIGGGCEGMMPEEIELVADCLDGKSSYEEIRVILEDHKIDYILLDDEKQKLELESHGFETVLESQTTGPYYLLKTNIQY